MTKLVRLIVGALCALALSIGAAAPTAAAPDEVEKVAAAYQAPSAFQICHYFNVVAFEPADGRDWSVFRATDFNLYGHFGVGCTIYPTPPGYPNYQFVCWIYDRNTGEGFWINCPTPP